MAKVGFVSLGCPKNLVDSEVMLGLLHRDGHEVTANQSEAEIIVVNTCAFIESARQESVDTILEMAQQKIEGKCKRLIVAGCLVERYRSEILAQIPEVDAVIGTNEIPRILEMTVESPPVPVYQNRELYLYSDTDPRLLTTPSYSAYVKIAEGCDHPCTFCVIPKMRGRFRSRPPESILNEVRRLAQSGVKEVNLVGQDTTMYGWDLGNRTGLADLLRSLGEVEGIEWIRFLYAYPNNIYPELLEAIAQTPKVCSYIDVPLQHASREVLSHMKRGGNRRSLVKLLNRIRSAIPDVAVRTTVIVGFPSETEEEFDELMDFVQEAQFDRLGCFCYSDEENSESFTLDGKVPEQLKAERRKKVMQLQSKISRAKNRKLVGSTLPVLIEGPSPQTELLWQGRLSTQAPDIDGVVFLSDGITPDLCPGEIAPVRITEAHEHDLIGIVSP